MLTAWAITQNGNIDLRRMHANRRILMIGWLVEHGHIKYGVEQYVPPTELQAQNQFDFHRAGTGTDVVEIVVTKRYDNG